MSEFFRPFRLNITNNTENIKKFQIDVKFDLEMQEREETMLNMITEGLSRLKLKYTEMEDEEFNNMIEFMKQRIEEMKERVEKAYTVYDHKYDNPYDAEWARECLEEDWL